MYAKRMCVVRGRKPNEGLPTYELSANDNLNGQGCGGVRKGYFSQFN